MAVVFGREKNAEYIVVMVPGQVLHFLPLRTEPVPP